MFVQPDIHRDALPARAHLGLDFEPYLDEAVTALATYTPSIVDEASVHQSRLVITSLQDRSSKQVEQIGQELSGRKVEIDGRLYELGAVCGAGEDGVLIHASSAGRHGVLKFTWPFAAEKEMRSELDVVRMESALIERQALIEIAYAPPIVPLTGPFILPRLYAAGVVVADFAQSPRVCVPALFMEHISGSNFEDFVHETLPVRGTLKDYIQVSLGALKAQYFLADLGNPEETHRGVFRMDNGVQNILIHESPERGFVPVLVDYGNAAVPNFTGRAGNTALSPEENRQAKLEIAVEQLRRALAHALEVSNFQHPLKSDVVAMLSSVGRYPGSTLLDTLESMYFDPAVAPVAESCLDDSMLIRLPEISVGQRKALKKSVA